MLNLLKRTFKIASLRTMYLSPRLHFNFSTSTNLAIYKSDTPAVLERKPDAILINQWWSQTPFDSTKPLVVPVFHFHSGEYAGENIELDHSVFNLPLRRDIVHNVHHWRRFLYRQTTHITRTKGTVQGSGKKPHPQKGTGRARQGNKRAPGRKKGGKAHGAQPRDYSYNMPKKIRLLALKTLLSAKLAEGKVRIIDTEKIDEPKTRIVGKIMKQFDEKNNILIITSYKPDSNFEKAQENIPNLEQAHANNLNVLKLLGADKVLITKDGLDQIIQNFKDRKSLRFRIGRRFNRDPMPSELQRTEAFGLKSRAAERNRYDPNQPLKFKFKILEDYLKDYEKVKKGEPIEIKSEKSEK